MRWPVPALAAGRGLLATPALAKPPRISLVFGPDAIGAGAEDEDIRSVRRVDDGERGAALVIRLDAAFDARITALTKAHVGDTGQLQICGETVAEPCLTRPIFEAMFVITDTDIARIDRLQALLAGPHCGDKPENLTLDAPRPTCDNRRKEPPCQIPAPPALPS